MDYKTELQSMKMRLKSLEEDRKAFRGPGRLSAEKERDLNFQIQLMSMDNLIAQYKRDIELFKAMHGLK